MCEDFKKLEAIKKKNIEGVKQIITMDGVSVKKGMLIAYGNIDRLKKPRSVAQDAGANRSNETQLNLIRLDLQKNEEELKTLSTKEEEQELRKCEEIGVEISGKIEILSSEISLLQEELTKVSIIFPSNKKRQRWS